MSHLEKYYRLNLEWPALAGNLDQTLKAQRRLIERLSKIKHTEEVKSLIVSVAASIEATEALIKWTHNMLTEVGKDSEVLIDAAKTRDTLEFQSEVILSYMNK